MVDPWLIRGWLVLGTGFVSKDTSLISTEARDDGASDELNGSKNRDEGGEKTPGAATSPPSIISTFNLFSTYFRFMELAGTGSSRANLTAEKLVQ